MGEDKDERVYKRIYKMVKVEWNLYIYKRRVEKLRLFSLEMWRDRANIIELFKILKGIVKIDKIFFYMLFYNIRRRDYLKLMEG